MLNSKSKPAAQCTPLIWGKQNIKMINTAILDL